jgi:hypothetical protein
VLLASLQTPLIPCISAAHHGFVYGSLLIGLEKLLACLERALCIMVGVRIGRREARLVFL